VNAFATDFTDKFKKKLWQKDLCAILTVRKNRSSSLANEMMSLRGNSPWHCPPGQVCAVCDLPSKSCGEQSPNNTEIASPPKTKSGGSQRHYGKLIIYRLLDMKVSEEWI